MKLVNNTPNWIQVDDTDEIPAVKDWTFDDVYSVLTGVLLNLHSCGKYTLIYRAEITLRREGPIVKGQDTLIVEIECKRDGETLRYAGNVQNINNLPAQSFNVYQLEHLVSGDI